MGKKIAYTGLAAAAALVLSYFERFIDLGIPGVKPGISNIAVLLVMYLFTTKAAFFVLVIKVVFGAIFGGNLSALLLSLSGGLLSFAGMVLCKRCRWFSVIGVSTAGGVLHNIGQLTAAAFVLRSGSVWYYLPFLLIAGIFAGVFTGAIAKGVIAAIDQRF